MQKFSEQFKKLEGYGGMVVLEHSIFDRQVHYCDEIHILEDADRIGLVIKDQEIFVYKQGVKTAEVLGSMYVISDDMLTITAIIENL